MCKELGNFVVSIGAGKVAQLANYNDSIAIKVIG